MKGLQIFSVIDVVALIAGLAIYLFIVGRQLKTVAGKLEEAADLVWEIKIVAGALPLLYTFAEAIVTGATYKPTENPDDRPPNFPAMGTRRSRQLDGVGFIGK